MSDEWVALLPFDTDDEAFVRGVEVGRVWALVRAHGCAWDFTVHAANAEMMLRIAEACARTVRSEELGDGWMVVRFEVEGSAR